MSRTVIILSEDALRSTDADHIAALHPGADIRAEVLVPADTERNVVSEFIDHLGLLDLRAAWDDVLGHHPTENEARAEASEAVETSVAELTRAGLPATGYVVADDPLPAVSRAIGQAGAIELIVVTEPQMVEDTFHRSWAVRARETLGIPVLHFYTGTDFVGR